MAACWALLLELKLAAAWKLPRLGELECAVRAQGTRRMCAFVPSLPYKDRHGLDSPNAGRLADGRLIPQNKPVWIVWILETSWGLWDFPGAWGLSEALGWQRWGS